LRRRGGEDVEDVEDWEEAEDGEDWEDVEDCEDGEEWEDGGAFSRGASGFSRSAVVGPDSRVAQA
jgi:hypothetical protein